MKIIKIVISILAFIIALIHITWPDLSIDYITLTLFIIAIFPWSVPLLKSLEFPGGLKIEFNNELEKTTKRAEKAGLISEDIPESPQYSFQLVADQDPNLALAGLRIEIEMRLNEIAKRRKISSRNKGVSQLLSLLAESGILSDEEKSVLGDLIGLLNKSVHGLEVDNKSADWAIQIGPRILRTLDEKLIFSS
jgi:hypothetical protein